tara:strand:+ start:3125 stop:3568 length:444 start_codon:yes stop_codon:yes gene_type:complete
MTEDNAKDDAKSSEDAPTEEEALMEDMEEFVLALNRFVSLVEGMDWPENFQLAKDQKHCFHVFRTFWRQRMRQRRENSERGRHDDVRFQAMSKEDVRRFFRNRFSREFFGDEDHAPLNIDPEEHQPDEEHTDEAAKERQQRFRDEWE